jgi:FKBP-type peptidyl-prolyl cis-trans isomerase SlpA
MTTTHDTSRVGPNSYLTLHYRVSLTSEEAIDTDVVNTFEDKPATLQMGTGQLSTPLEDCLHGMQCGDYAVFDLAAGEAFGPRNPELVQKVSRAALDVEGDFAASYQPGDMVQFPAPHGGSYTGVLKQITDAYALFDFNHPLAGQPVRFEVRIIGVM